MKYLSFIISKLLNFKHSLKTKLFAVQQTKK